MSKLWQNSPPKIFISYKRDVNPDENLAIQIYNHLSKLFDVFLDRNNILVGEEWAKRVEQELKSSDFMIILLTPDSIQSEMVVGEIERAHILRQETGYPHILPVRVSFAGNLQMPLVGYLGKFHWTTWNQSSDTQNLIEDLKIAIYGASLPNTSIFDDQIIPSDTQSPLAPFFSAQVKIELPEGTMDPNSEFYIRRNCDDKAINAIKREGITMPIKGPRQVGKSSLLIHVMEKSKEVEKYPVFIDFQLFDEESLLDPKVFFREFCSWISEEVGLENRVEEFWSKPLGNAKLCTNYIEQYLLTKSDLHLVLAMDEVERVLSSPFRSSFFSMLRNWHNSRSHKRIFKKIDLVMVISTEPYHLIDNLNQSPFNVGEIVEIEDFNEIQINTLVQRHGNNLSAKFLTFLNGQLNGHPYLTRKAIYLVLDNQYTEHEIIEHATSEYGPFGDHLRYQLFKIHKYEKLIRGYMQIINGLPYNDKEILWHLYSMGLTQNKKGRISSRCKLYSDFFNNQFGS